MDNGTFEALLFRNSFKKETDNHTLKLKLNGGAGLYQTTANANRYQLEAGLTYRVKYGKRKYFEFAPEFIKKKRQGINQAQAVLRTPFSYSQLIIPVKFDFYLKNKAWLKTEVGYLRKSYDRENDEELFYRAPFATVSLSKKWLINEKIHKVTISNNSQLRSYLELERIVEVIDDEEEEEMEFEEEDFEEKTRNWNYFRNNIEYNFAGKEKKFRLTTGLYHIRRFDLDDRNSYNEIASGFNMSYQFKKLSLSGSIKYSIRNYDTLSPGAGNDVLLQYRYIRSSVGIEYKLKPNRLLFLKGHLIDRTSNNPGTTSLAFRGFFNASVEAGISIKF